MCVISRSEDRSSHFERKHEGHEGFRSSTTCGIWPFMAIFHHEVHEGHEGFRIFLTPNFVIFVSFVVNIFLPIWLRLSLTRSSVVKS